MFDNYTFTIFSYHPTIVLAFSSQDNSICLCLQFSNICFNKSLFPSNSFKKVAKDCEDLAGLVKRIFLLTFSFTALPCPQVSKQTIGRLLVSKTICGVPSTTLVKKNTSEFRMIRCTSSRLTAPSKHTH